MPQRALGKGVPCVHRAAEAPSPPLVSRALHSPLLLLFICTWSPSPHPAFFFIVLIHLMYINVCGAITSVEVIEQILGLGSLFYHVDPKDSTQ